ncbi:MarR family transcriptional regulator [Mucilaginibacter sp. PAMB04168]|uniref:MarR family winged helix-turn-helix transcriptional regulator n=1 Tax=Mucilaginibacter sp. PAMB04168 TaxID=3138567 RepID=UPI0031F6AA29
MMESKSKKDFPEHNDDKNWARLVYIAKKHLDIWSHQSIRPGQGQLKLSYMPLIFNISTKGSTNTEIAKRSLTAKQAMSRTVKELEDKGMISTQPLSNDKRSYQINLTDEGLQFVQAANLRLSNLVANYKLLVGEDEFNIATEVLHKIIRYHEQMNSDEATEE